MAYKNNHYISEFITQPWEFENRQLKYYCFKNNIEEDDEKEGDDWKIGTKYENGEDEIIPEEINSLIEQAFKTQLNKFIKI